MILVIVTTLLFAIGLYGVLSRRDLVGVLASVEVMLGAAMMLLVGLAMTFESSQVAAEAGRIQAVVVLLLAVTAAETSVAMALAVAVAKRNKTTLVDEMSEVRG